MSAPTPQDSTHGWLALSRDPAALIAPDNSLLSWNSAFQGEVADELVAGMGFPLQGDRLMAALTTASSGGVGMCHLMQDTDGTKASWLLLALPQGNSQRLVILTQGEASFAYHDEITHLPNRRDANERLVLEWRRMLRKDDSRFSIALVDIDHFKHVNDRYGHDVGDEALRFVGKRLTSFLRAGDWVARWGGEEFLVFLHQISLDEARAVAERLRAKFAARPFVSATGANIPLTLCLGVVCSDTYLVRNGDSATNLANMVDSADVLLYDAKQNGRNCSVVQQAGEKIYWDGQDLDDLVSNDGITACAGPVTDTAGQLVGSVWHMGIRGAGPNAASHVVRSARKQNRVPFLDTAWLARVRAACDPAAAGPVAFIPIALPTLLQIATGEGFVAGVLEFLAAGNKLVFIVADELLVAKTTAATLAFLRQHGIELCLCLNNPEFIPTGLINLLNPSYALLDTAAQYSDIQHTLRDHSVRAILPVSQQDPSLGNDPLYLGDHPAS